MERDTLLAATHRRSTDAGRAPARFRSPQALAAAAAVAGRSERLPRSVPSCSRPYADGRRAGGGSGGAGGNAHPRASRVLRFVDGAGGRAPPWNRIQLYVARLRSAAPSRPAGGEAACLPVLRYRFGLQPALHSSKLSLRRVRKSCVAATRRGSDSFLAHFFARRVLPSLPFASRGASSPSERLRIPDPSLFFPPRPGSRFRVLDCRRGTRARGSRTADRQTWTPRARSPPGTGPPKRPYPLLPPSRSRGDDQQKRGNSRCPDGSDVAREAGAGTGHYWHPRACGRPAHGFSLRARVAVRFPQ